MPGPGFGAAPVAALDLLSQGEPVVVKTRQIAEFEIGRDTRVFGPVRFLGGLELISANRDIGGLSALLSLEQGGQILAVTDNGIWMAADVRQAPDGAPLGLANVRISPLLDKTGRTLRAAWGHDTEALALSGETLYVAAERANTIYRYPWPLATGTERMVAELPAMAEIKALRGTKGLEAMAIGPAGSALSDTLVAVAERGPSDGHDLPGFLIRDGHVTGFSLARSDRYDATDIVFLPDGDLLLLERRFNLRDLVGMRLRRFAAAEIVPGAVLTGEILLEADYSFQIDNMEALTVHLTPDGETILTVLSDNNRSLLQRTLLLRFRLEN